jgi:hypothetical protein
VVEEEDSVLSFNRLRKVEKQERRNEDLSSLENDFFLSAAQYLEDKENSGNRREYMNAKRLFKRIVSQRRQKVVKNARLSLKSDIKASELSLLPRETELFLSLKDDFERHEHEIEDVVENGGSGSVPRVETPSEQSQEEAGTDRGRNERRLRKRAHKTGRTGVHGHRPGVIRTFRTGGEGRSSGGKRRDTEKPGER